MPETNRESTSARSARTAAEGYEVESVPLRRMAAQAAQGPPHARSGSSRRARLGPTGCWRKCRLEGSLPAISPRLGELVRTNSESILTVTVPEDYPDNLIERVAITSSIYPDPKHPHRDRHLRR